MPFFRTLPHTHAWCQVVNLLARHALHQHFDVLVPWLRKGVPQWHIEASKGAATVPADGQTLSSKRAARS